MDAVVRSRYAFATTRRNVKGLIAMTKTSTSSRKVRAPKVVRDIPLKTILNDIMKADKTRTLTTKQMRVVLRREFAVAMSHARNAAWTFTPDEANIVRARFDAKFRAKMTKVAKPRKAKAPKVETPAPEAA